MECMHFRAEPAHLVVNFAAKFLVQRVVAVPDFLSKFLTCGRKFSADFASELHKFTGKRGYLRFERAHAFRQSL